ncbi:MAG: DNA polymerase III subunit beta, partial [Methylococcales bacterium]
MKFTINREVFLLPLQQIVNVIEKRQTMPILSNILLTMNAGILTLTGSDLEIQLVADIKIEETENSAITVPARKILDIIRLLPPESKINIELNKDKLKIVSGRSRFSLTTLEAINYPAFDEKNLHT